MALEQKLVDLLQEITEKQTFSLEGLKAVQELKTRAEFVDKRNEELEQRNRDLKAENDNARRLLADSDSQNEKLKTRLGAIEKRELDCTIAETVLKCEKEKGALVIDMFKTVFKNTIVRENVCSSVPLAGPGGGYGTTMPGSETRSRETE